MRDPATGTRDKRAGRGGSIACSLNAEELPARLAEIRAIGADALLGVDVAGGLRFRNDDATRARLEAIVAAESECCSFLDFQLRATGDELNLSITAPEGAEALADHLRRAFADRHDERP